MIVKPERSGWRDEELSRRHRDWGANCPAIDVDFLMIEYDTGHPSGIVEYKHERAAPQYPRHASYRAIKALADNSHIPFFVCRYSDDLTRYVVTPLNDYAEQLCNTRNTEMTEVEWVTLIYNMRGRSLPESVRVKLMR